MIVRAKRAERKNASAFEFRSDLIFIRLIVFFEKNQ